MGIWTDILNAFNSEPPTLAELASGQCVLPQPVQKAKAVKAPPKSDSYIENKDTNTFGFNRTTATAQSDGAVSHLTGYDKDVLKDRGYWSITKSVTARNAEAKKHWYAGKTRKEAARLVGVSESWIEKRFGSFTTALSMEQTENPLF
jgi:hypothetical protein